MSYRDALHFLVATTEVVELYNDYGGRVAICPAWGGRIMTSACDGLDGDSFGLVPVAAIEQWGKQRTVLPHTVLPHSVLPPFGEFGGEDRLLLNYCSGGVSDGVFSLLPESSTGSSSSYAPGLFSDGAMSFPLVLRHRDAPLALDLDRQIRLLACGDLAATFGSPLCTVLERGDASFVAFESTNTATYRGAATHDARISLRIEGAFNASNHAIAVLPFRHTHESRHAIRTDYFGFAPHRRLRFIDHAACLRADGHRRCQVGATYIAALPIVGSIDFRNGTLTLIHYTLPPVSTEPLYLATESADKTANDLSSSYTLNNGDVVRATNAGPLFAHPEEAQHSHAVLHEDPAFATPFYTWETCSPATLLEPGMSLTHRQQTVHVVADQATLSELATLYLDNSANTLFAALFA